MLETNVSHLAEARENVKKKEDSVSFLLEILGTHTVYQDYLGALDDLKDAKANEKELYTLVCETAEHSFDGKNKHPHPAITLKEFTVVDYPDDLMKAWAIEHNHPGMLNLNKRAANKVATGPTAPEFVTIEKELRATIKTDLSEYHV